MILAYELTMPKINTWNNHWSGENNYYAATRTYRGQAGKKKADKIFQAAPYHYNWEDGWSARIRVLPMTSREAAKIRRKSKGFLGYEWMIDSIEDIGIIKASHER